jgi:hypothetical protein
VPRARLAGRGGRTSRPDRSDTDDEPISPKLARELARQIKEIRDPTRYVIVSAFTRRFLLYYDVRDDSYPMNNLESATLFKRRSVAEAVMSVLGDHHVIMTVRLGKNGAIKRVTPLGRLVVRATRRSPAECSDQRARWL